jgi:hypothetical protein
MHSSLLAIFHEYEKLECLMNKSKKIHGCTNMANVENCPHNVA